MPQRIMPNSVELGTSFNPITNKKIAIKGTNKVLGCSFFNSIIIRKCILPVQSPKLQYDRQNSFQ